MDVFVLLDMSDELSSKFDLFTFLLKSSSTEHIKKLMEFKKLINGVQSVNYVYLIKSKVF